MIKMKKILLPIFFKLSRFIYWFIPIEFRTNHDLTDTIVDDAKKRSFEIFKKELEKSALFNDYEKIRKYSIETALLNDKNLEKII